MAAFEAAKSELDAEGVSIVGASTDPQDRARETARKLGLSFPLGYGLEPEATADLLGAFYDEQRGIVHATGIVARPDGLIGVACYSTGPIGRLHVSDVLGVVRFWKAREAKKR